jgi:hypothetical protein
MAADTPRTTSFPTGGAAARYRTPERVIVMVLDEMAVGAATDLVRRVADLIQDFREFGRVPRERSPPVVAVVV